jgi:hypothetical protein
VEPFGAKLVYDYSVDPMHPTATVAAEPPGTVRKFECHGDSRTTQALRHRIPRPDVRGAGSALRAHKLRSALTLLGVTLSVSVLMLVVSIITGANLYIQDRVANLGSNVFLILRFPSSRISRTS